MGNLLNVYLNCDRIHASNLTLDHLIIQTPEQPVGPVYEEMGLEIITHKLTIRGCLVKGRNASKVNGLCFVNSSNVTLNDVNFYNLNTAIIYNCKRDAGATSTSWTGKHEISRCWFTDNKKTFAIYDQSFGANYDMTPPDSILFHHNTIREGIGNEGIVINKEKVFIKIYNNSVKGKPALEISNVKTTIPIYNNYLSHFAKDTLLEPAVKFTNTANHSFIYNSVWGQLSLKSANNLLFRNNSLYDQFQPALTMDDQSTLNSDYNNLYSNSPVLATLENTTTGYIQEFPSLDSLKTVTNREQHSISYNPYYRSEDLYSNSAYLKNKAIPFGLITTDFDDKPRNTTAPDIGASEIVLLEETVWPGDANAWAGIAAVPRMRNTVH
ncbi:MAG TPA: right-handed parallel beta-helix repeat-containing protein, partial [Bacteroidia bacterium]|nr:right-handed parallel beta-helix repeat-containing protein [Bacteroidia bacterium]